MSARLPRILTALILLGLAAVEAAHGLSGRAWPGFQPIANVIGFLLVPLFLAGALAALVPARQAWLVSGVAAAAAIAHAVVVRTGGSAQGFIYLAGGAAALLLLMRAVQTSHSAPAPVFRRIGPRLHRLHPA